MPPKKRISAVSIGKSRKISAPDKIVMPKTTRKSKTKRPVVKSIYDEVRKSSFRKEEPSKKPSRPSVLVRSTTKAMIHAENHIGPVDMEREPHTQQAGGRCMLTAMPPEILTRICRYAVVDPSHFVYPVSITGKEQPDLAMSCRALRAVVLPIYYAENVFALDMTASFGPRAKKVLLWMQALQLWTPHIQRWTFVIEKNSSQPDDEVQAVLLSLVTRPPEKESDHGYSVPSPVIEVHRSARCLMSSVNGDQDQCTIQMNPTWLIESVISSLDVGVSYAGKLDPEMMYTFLSEMSPKLEQLFVLCCRPQPGYRITLLPSCQHCSGSHAEPCLEDNEERSALTQQRPGPSISS